jgi:protease-4
MSEDKALYDLVKAYIKERRRARRWDLGFRIVKYFFVIFFLFAFLGSVGEREAAPELTRADHTALIDVEGVIASSETASADNIISALRKAMDNRHAKAVILRINSPGGSPVQAGYVYDEIRRLRELHPDKKVYAVITDIGASAAYYIASAADEIFADRASLVGSIGITMDATGLASFGFTEAMKKLGIERRMITSGESKNFLDPFSPLKPADRAHQQAMMDEVHRQFIEAVEKGRGKRLKPSKQLFSGLVWTGEKGVKLGLVDKLGSSRYVAREVIGAERIVDYTLRPSYFQQFTEGFGAAVARGLIEAGMERSLQIR